MFSALRDEGLFSLLVWILLIFGVLSLFAELIIVAFNRWRHGVNGLSKRAHGFPVATVRRPFELEPQKREAKGVVFMRGELWTARCDVTLAETLRVGDRVEIEKIDGLVARIKGRAV